jgi:hypothetical protein
LKSAKYNFRRKENKEKAVYRLVMYLREGSGIRGSYIDKNGNRIMVIYGYYDKPDFGLQMLRNMMHRYRSKIKMGVIYAKPNLNPNHTDFSEIIESIK